MEKQSEKREKNELKGSFEIPWNNSSEEEIKSSGILLNMEIDKDFLQEFSSEQEKTSTELFQNKLSEKNFNEIFTFEDIDRTLKENRGNNSLLCNNLFTEDKAVTLDSENKLEEGKKEDPDSIKEKKEDPNSIEEKNNENTATEMDLKKGENTGQDPMKPLTRFDIRFKYQNPVNDGNNWILTLRMDKPIHLENKWTIGLRFDMPFMWNDLPNRYKNYQNPEGNYNFGSGDLFTKIMFITPHEGRHSYGFGLQAIFPTESDDQFGYGKYTISPIVAGLYYPECLKKGSYAGLLLRNEFSYAGDDYRTDINQLVIQPAFNVNLPDRWFITMAPEIYMNWENGQWFVPFDIMLGKLVTPTTVMSIEYKAGLIKDYPLYDYELEFRTGFFY
jgi:hypothetical protein